MTVSRRNFLRQSMAATLLGTGSARLALASLIAPLRVDWFS